MAVKVGSEREVGGESEERDVFAVTAIVPYAPVTTGTAVVCDTRLPLFKAGARARQVTPAQARRLARHCQRSTVLAPVLQAGTASRRKPRKRHVGRIALTESDISSRAGISSFRRDAAQPGWRVCAAIRNKACSSSSSLPGRRGWRRCVHCAPSLRRGARVSPSSTPSPPDNSKKLQSCQPRSLMCRVRLLRFTDASPAVRECEPRSK